MAQPGTGASKVEVGEETPTIRQIVGVATAVAAILCVTERGPVGLEQLCTSFEEYTRLFGRDIADGDGSHEARGFFAEGGQELHVVRVVHYTDPTNAASATSAASAGTIPTAATSPTSGTVLGSALAPFDLEPGDTLVVTINGGGPATATFTATAAARESAAENYALSNGQILTVSINGGGVQTITFATANFVSIGAATAEEVAAVINAQIVGAHATVTSGGTKVTITSDRRGSTSGVNVTGGNANTALLFTTGNIAGTGNTANVDAVTFAEVKTIVEAAVAGCTVTDGGSGKVRITSNTTGTGSSVLVGASSTADDELGLDNATHSGTTGAAQDTLTTAGKTDGAYGDDVSFRVADASNGVAAEFNLQVLEDGIVAQTFVNLTMDSTATRYVETIVNDEDTGTPLATLTDLGLLGTTAERRPANGTYTMTGGDDGLASLADADFVGDPTAKTGLYALDIVSDLRLLACPDRATSAVHNAMLSYAEVYRKGSLFVVLDPPADMDETEIVEYVQTTAALEGSSEFGAMYAPRIQVLNPNVSVFGDEATIVVPPSGVIMGVMARTDASRPGGVYLPPAGIEEGRMTTCLGFEGGKFAWSLDERKRDIVYPHRVNPLTTDKGLPRYIDGVYTLKSNGQFPTVAERRGVIYIEQSVKGPQGIQFARHKNNDESLRRNVERTIDAFLLQQMRDGAFRSRDPKKAFLVDFGVALNPESLVFAGQMRGRMGLATQKPAEFIFVGVSQDTRALDAELAAAS